MIEKPGIQSYSIRVPKIVTLFKNKPGKVKIGAISKAQKAPSF